MEKVCNENETRKLCMLNEWKWFISHKRKTGETDCYEVLVNDS